MATNISTKGPFKPLSRFELMNFINHHLEFGNSLKHVEQLCTGDVYCQLMEKLFPNLVALTHVKLETKLEHECINKFKILEASFKKMTVDKDIPIEKLI